MRDRQRMAFSGQRRWSVFEQIMPKREKADRRHPAIDWREALAAFAMMRAESEDGDVAADVLMLVALTGVRLSEAREAKWSEINFDYATWTIPASRMKKRAEHVVSLSSQTLELLTRLKSSPARTRLGKGDVFSRSYTQRGLIWKLCKGLTDGRGSPHGWRATFRSWCADNGVDREVAESALAHKIGGTEGSYNRAQLIERRGPVMSAWSSFLAGESSATIVPFAGKRS